MSKLNSLLTGKDNKSLDFARVAIFFGAVALCAAFICVTLAYVFTLRGGFDLEKIGILLRDFATSLATLVGWGSVGIAAKAHTEPPPAHHQPTEE